MTNDQINRIIAEYCCLLIPEIQNPNSLWDDIWLAKTYNKFNTPDFCNDLNAMYQAEQKFIPQMEDEFGTPESTDQWETYCYWLAHCTKLGYMNHASAKERAIAFVKTIKRWTE